MGRIDRDKDGNLAIAIVSEGDAAQLRAKTGACEGWRRSGSRVGSVLFGI